MTRSWVYESNTQPTGGLGAYTSQAYSLFKRHWSIPLYEEDQPVRGGFIKKCGTYVVARGTSLTAGNTSHSLTRVDNDKNCRVLVGKKK